MVMTQTPVRKLVLSLAAPTVASMLVTAIYNMADTYFVSHISTDASAAVGVVFSIQSLIQAVGFGLGMGCGSLVSRLLGADDKKNACKYASSAVFCAFIFGLALLIYGTLDIDRLMSIFGADKDVLPYAKDYGLYILFGAPIMCCSFVFNNVLRAEGKARFAMVGLTVGGILNIILDPILIFDKGLGLGTEGAALATVISQCISFCILASFFARRKTEVALSLKNISRKLTDYLMIIKTGVPTVCRQGLASVATTLLNRAALPYTSAAVAAVTIATKLYLFIRNAVIGIGQGFMPVAGYNYGAKNYRRVTEAFRFSVFIGSVVTVSATVIFALFAPSLIALFRESDMQVIHIGSKALYLLCLSLPVMAYSTYVNQLLQCLGKVKRATFLAACRNGIFYIPLMLILPHFFGLTGILFVQPLADLLTCAISIPFHLSFFKNEFTN